MTIQRLPRTLSCLIVGLSLSVVPASAQNGAITNVGTTVTEMDAITFNSSGVLYGATGGTGSLYTIDPTTGSATLVHAFVGASNASLTYGVNGLAFQSGTGTLYGTTSPDSPNSGNSLVIINPASGQVTVIGPSGTGFPYTNIAFAPNGTLYGWLVSAGAASASLAIIDLTTGAGAPLGSPQNNVIIPYVGLAISQDGIVYVAANGYSGAPACGGSCSGALWLINPLLGWQSSGGTLSGGPGVAPAICALAFSPAGVLYGIEGGGGGGWNLVTIEKSVPTVADTVTNVGVTVTEMDAITFDSSGVLYGATGGTGSLYTIDPTTGSATLVHAFVGASNASLTYGLNGLAFQPATGTLYGTTSPDAPNSGNSLVTINPATGQVTVIGPSGTGFPYTNIAFAPNGTLYGWLVSAGGATASLASINLTTGAGTSLGSPQPNVTVPWVGLAIDRSGAIYVAANGHAGACGSCSGALWTVNPANGSPTTIGTIYNSGPGVSQAFTALAFSPTGVLYAIEGGEGGGWNLVLINMAPVADSLIGYALTTTVSGTLGTSSFTNATVTLTITGNTSGITAGTGGLAGYVLNTGTATLDISGLGTATLTDPIAIVATVQTPLDGLYGVLFLDTNSGTGILYQAGPAFYGYLLGPFGTLSGGGGPASGSHMQSFFPTNKGELSFIYASASGTSTFTASLQTSPTAECDITGDTTTTVSDVQTEISEALGVAPPVNDLNGDGVINVADVEVVVNAALGLGCSPSAATPASSNVSMHPDVTARRIGGGGLIVAAQLPAIRR